MRPEQGAHDLFFGPSWRVKRRRERLRRKNRGALGGRSCRADVLHRAGDVDVLKNMSWCDTPAAVGGLDEVVADSAFMFVAEDIDDG